MSLLLTSVYAGNVQYFSKIAHCKDVTLEAHGHYLRQTYRTRCRIATAEGVQDLNIPVERGELAKPFDRDIRIASSPWQKLHWGAITTAYRKSPFLDYLTDDLQPLYEKSYKFLWDFQQDMLQFLLTGIGLEVTVGCSDDFAPLTANDTRLLADARHPQSDPHFAVVPYYQPFAERLGFLPNLSALDLLLNMGPESLLVLHQSYRP